MKLNNIVVECEDCPCQYDGHCLPVVDNHDKVQGMITTFDIYSVLLKAVFG